MRDHDFKTTSVRNAFRFGTVAATAWMIAMTGPAMAQASGDNAMSGMQTETAAPPPAGDRPGVSMALPDPMEEPFPDEGVQRATLSRGGQPLAYETVGGVKVFQITASPLKWQILPKFQSLPEIWATTWSYNGQIPGPMIRVTEGDRVRVILKNGLPDPTSIHWHGLRVPNNMDGVAEPAVTQQPVKPGETFTYEFTVKDAGTFFYHSHVETDRQIPAGLSGAFIVDPKASGERVDVDYTAILQEWRVNPTTGKTWPAMPSMTEPNFFTVNGKSFPATETLEVKKGQKVRIRFIGAGQFAHPMHLHGFPFKIVATDGYPVPKVAQLTKDTINVAPGERYDIEFVADEEGTWIIHCHILHHATNDDLEPGGLIFAIKVMPQSAGSNPGAGSVQPSG
jgi:FtsP/CotA-like multicopper oxidase with cupredoxin domain